MGAMASIAIVVSVRSKGGKSEANAEEARRGLSCAELCWYFTACLQNQISEYRIYEIHTIHTFSHFTIVSYEYLEGRTSGYHSQI
jgi:hypothetical protein